MTDLNSFAADVERISDDKALDVKDKYKGNATFLKAANKQDASRARLELFKVGNAKVFEKFVYTGTFLYEFSCTDNKVRVHDMPQNKLAAGQQESFLTFFFGMGSEQAKARYLMEYKGSDEYYHYIRVQPRQAQDRNDFSEAQLSLFRDKYLPAQVWYRQPNGNQITWNFSKLQIDAKIPLSYFHPDLTGWTVERVLPRSPAAAPRTPAGKP